jgi:hypothetical protein
MILSWAGDDTSALAYDITGANLQTALEGLTGIGAGQVSVTGDGPYVVEFTGTLAKTDVAEITGVGGKNEVQTITISGGEAGDTMILSWDGDDTAELAYDISGADLQTALEGLTGIGAGQVSVTGDGPYVVEFTGTLAKTDVAEITGVGGKNEVQTISCDGTAGDTMVLSLGGQSTAELAYDISTADLQTALRGLSTIGAGNCNVTGTPGTEYIVEFVAGKALTDVDEITGVGGSNETQTVSLDEVTDGGTFTLTYDTKTTAAIDWDATAADVQEALEGLSNISAGDVSVTGTSGAWIVEFTGTLAKTNVAELTGTDVDLTGTGHGITIATTHAGHSMTIASVETYKGNELAVGVVETYEGNTLTVGVVETYEGNELTVGVVETYEGNELTVGVVETYEGNELTVGVVETYEGNELTVGVVETYEGKELTVGVVETYEGNELTVAVTETSKGDADGTVAAVVVSQASDGLDYSWIGM